MSEFLDKIENEGFKKGWAIGFEQELEQIILKMIEDDISDQQIIICTGASEEKIKELRGTVSCAKV